MIQQFYFWKKVKVKVAQSCPTLCDSMDCIVHGILQARILEWVSFPFSRGSSQPLLAVYPKRAKTLTQKIYTPPCLL